MWQSWWQEPWICSFDFAGFDFAQPPGKDSLNYLKGFNGQERDDDETNGTGITLGAKFLEYDPKLERRWNLDTVIKYRKS